jgi:CubicO group peptidase (beta-lactamase class C family)
MEGLIPPQELRIPKNEWDRPPWNRWAFQNVRKLLKTSNVRHGHREIQPLESNIQDLTNLSFKSSDGTSMSIGTMVEETYTDGFLIYKNGQVIHESYFNGMNPSSLHLAQSVSKSIVATVAGIMIGQKLLDPKELISFYLPELKYTGWNGATLQHVLDMTSGVKYSEEYTNPTSDVGKTDIASGWHEISECYDQSIDWPLCIWDQIISLKETDSPHGKRFDYRSIESDVIAHVMEQVSGQDLADLVSTKLWTQIGAEEDAYFTVDSSGYSLASGGFNATLRDFARFGVLYLNNGLLNQEQIIPKEWVTDTMTGKHGLFDECSEEIFPNGRYRNQFWVEDNSKKTIICRGVFGQIIYISPEYNMVAVKLSTWPEFSNKNHTINTLNALHEIGRTLT